MDVPPNVRAVLADLDALNAALEGRRLRGAALDAALSVLRRRRSDRKGQALADQLRAALAVSNDVDLGEWVIHIEDVTVLAGSGAVALSGVTVAHLGVPLDGFDPSRTWTNPPPLVDDPAGDVINPQTGNPARIDPAGRMLLEILEAAQRGGP